jgi:hypothetical protein
MLISDFGDTLEESVKALSAYKYQEGKKYDSDYHTLLNFRDRQRNNPPKIKTTPSMYEINTGPKSAFL